MINSKKLKGIFIRTLKKPLNTMIPTWAIVYTWWRRNYTLYCTLTEQKDWIGVLEWNNVDIYPIFTCLTWYSRNSTAVSKCIYFESAIFFFSKLLAWDCFKWFIIKLAKLHNKIPSAKWFYYQFFIRCTVTNRCFCMLLSRYFVFIFNSHIAQ